MNTVFEQISHTIRQRRTVKPNQMNGNRIPDAKVMQLLELADWAPTHGHTEPWRFIVYTGTSLQHFCQQHAELYKAHSPAEKFMHEKYSKLGQMGDKASHLIIAVMERGKLPKIPVLEEIAATSCAIQNLLLGATALGIASYWGSGGMAYHPAMHGHLQLNHEDLVLGFLYLGYTDKEPVEGKRVIPLTEKIKWM